MVRDNKSKECYKKDSESGALLPDDQNHNCELFKYDEEDHSYVSNYLMRKVVNLGVVVGAVIAGVKFVNSPVFHETRDIFLYGGVFSLGYMMMTNNLPMKFVDGLYATTGYDLVWDMTDDINDTIYVVSYIPRMMWSYFTSAAEETEVSVNSVTTQTDNSVEDRVINPEDFHQFPDVANDSRSEVSEKISNFGREMASNLKESLSEVCVSCEIGNVVNGDFFRDEE